ncbi:MAG TPA: carboxypeptidase regulatory-like domain-containing protein [Terricaulis sp.]|nr:carboxypeptidase regulatory-like domain-containing protein [Terricaulis sp.]
MASAAAIAAFSAAPAWANEISGQVTDRSEVQSLEGAQIEIVELRRSTQSAIDGRFRFADVPAGQYTLRVRYAAAAPQTLSVTVPATGVSNVNIALAAAAGTDEILVIGQRASLASSISRQRASDTVETVLTRDGIGHFPDQNVAESVRRAPGAVAWA